MARTPAATRSIPFERRFWRSSSSAFRSRASNTRPRSDDAAKRRYWPTTSAYVVSWLRFLDAPHHRGSYHAAAQKEQAMDGHGGPFPPGTFEHEPRRLRLDGGGRRHRGRAGGRRGCCRGLVRPVPRPLRRVEWAYQGVIPVRRRRCEGDLDGLGGRLALFWLSQRLNHCGCVVELGLPRACAACRCNNFETQNYGGFQQALSVGIRVRDDPRVVTRRICGQTLHGKQHARFSGFKKREKPAPTLETYLYTIGTRLVPEKWPEATRQSTRRTTKRL